MFSVLNMCSANSIPSDDRSAKARIRDAAIQLIAEGGARSARVRAVATAAGVSPALVIHHFDSMEGLRAACDAHVVALIRDQKKQVAADGAALDVLAALREGTAPWLLGYLASVLVDDSPAVERLVDEMVADAEEYTEDFVEAGMLKPSEHPHARAALTVIWSLGSLVLHRHLERLLGVDFKDPDVVLTPGFAEYSLATYEIYGEGIMTREALAAVRQAFSRLSEGEDA